MSDLGKQGGLAGANEALPREGGMPTEVAGATAKAPEGDVKFGIHSEGIGNSRPTVH